MGLDGHRLGTCCLLSPTTKQITHLNMNRKLPLDLRLRIKYELFNEYILRFLVDEDEIQMLPLQTSQEKLSLSLNLLLNEKN